jgi:SAM-dependent methyltransferase
MPDWDDTDYAGLAADYAEVRCPDPRIRAQLAAALGDARTVLNVGAGTGSYEPTDRDVVAVEPSAEMRARRDPALAPAIDAAAADLPFDDDAFEAALAVFTIHHWPELERGLAEVRRVTSGPIVIMTADPEALGDLWLAEYSPEFHVTERRRYPELARVAAALGAEVPGPPADDPVSVGSDQLNGADVPGRRADHQRPVGSDDLDQHSRARPLAVRPLRIPLDCSDGFADAFYGRPERMLDPAVRRAQSAWSFVDADAQSRFTESLRADLASGAWDERHGHLRTQPEFVGSIRILIVEP